MPLSCHHVSLSLLDHYHCGQMGFMALILKRTAVQAPHRPPPPVTPFLDSSLDDASERDHRTRETNTELYVNRTGQGPSPSSEAALCQLSCPDQ